MQYSHEPKILDWSEAAPIFNYYLSVWNNHIPLNWASLAWSMLIKGGLCIYRNEQEELMVRSYAVAVSLIYYEYCHRTAWHEHDGFTYWNAAILETFKRELAADIKSDPEILFRVGRCLLEQIGEEYLTFELWTNCQESYQQHVFATKEKAELLAGLGHEQKVDISYGRGYGFIKSGDMALIEHYESVSGL